MSSAVTEKAEKLTSTLLKVFEEWRDACRSTVDHDSGKEKLRADAKALFSELFHTTEIATGNVVLKTKASHNEALARLIQELGPALSEDASLPSRICAIYCLCGAIEGCSSDGLSLQIMKLIGTFLLGHCGPIEDEDMDDNDEAVRDAAVTCLSSLVLSRIARESNDEPPVSDVIALRIDFARKGVERRCAAPDSDEMEYDHGYDFPSHGNDIRGGLSTLPRSRRSLCFALIRTCIDGIATDTKDPPESFSHESIFTLAKFAEFAANCLHGESDPRCLMQLLRTLHVLQVTLLPFFQIARDQTVKFPIMALFDAVAPYYPVQFTPPPNDVYGITRRGLTRALMDILCFTGYDELTSDQDTQQILSAGLFTERLLPLDTDQDTSSTVEDKKEALGDLESLLFPSGNFRSDPLPEITTRDISNALVATHADGASGVSRGGEDGRKHKELADSCRNLVVRLALSLESTGNQNSAWKVFVEEAVESLSPLLSSSPQSMQGRTATAYLACLAGSGGSRTLTLCLQSCLPPLVDILSEHSGDEERLTAAIYGAAAFFSSFKVAVERGSGDRIVLHPHPLEVMCGKTLRALCNLLSSTGSNGLSSTSPRVAATRAMEAVLLVTPLALLDESDVDGISDFFLSLMGCLVLPAEPTVSDIEDDDKEWKKASAQTLGSLLGYSFGEIDSEKGLQNSSSISSVVLDSEKLLKTLQVTILKDILSSAKRSQTEKPNSPRFDWLSLTQATQISRSAADLIMSSLVDSLLEALQLKDDSLEEEHPAITIASAISFVIRRGGDYAMVAFHSLSTPKATPMDILSAVLPTAEGRIRRSISKTLRRGISNLALPSTSDELTEMKRRVAWAYQIVELLLPAFDCDSSSTQIDPLLDHVSHVLPPLSDSQNAKLCVALPFLSLVLRHGKRTDMLDKRLRPMASSLADYALTGDDPLARSYAAASLYSIIVKFQGNDADPLECEVLRGNILPSIVDSFHGAQTNVESVGAFTDALNLAALVGSAAACRGGAASKVADEIASFFVELACAGKASVPLAEGDISLDLTADEAMSDAVEDEFHNSLRVAAASAFGAMLETEDGSPFWRQRLTHMTASQVLKSSTATLQSPELGILAIANHIVASSRLDTLGQATLTGLAEIVARGFVDSSNYRPDSVSFGELSITAVVKLMVVAPQTVLKYISTLIASFLRAYVSNEPMASVAVKLMALQGLLIASQCPEEFKSTVLASKRTVLSVLATASDQQSPVLRPVSVDVINSWSVLA